MKKYLSLFLSVYLGVLPCAYAGVDSLLYPALQPDGTVFLHFAVNRAEVGERLLPAPGPRAGYRPKVNIDKAYALRNPLSERALEKLRLQAGRFIFESGGHYEAYLRVLGADVAPESGAIPLQVNHMLRQESRELKKLFNRQAWAAGGVKRRQAVDFGLEITGLLAAMGAAGAVSGRVSGRFAAKQTFKHTGRLGGLASLSGPGGGRAARFLTGGAWKWYGWVRVKTFAVDLLVFSSVITPLVDFYDRLMPRLADYHKLSDRKIAFAQEKALLEAFEQLGRAQEADITFTAYDGGAPDGAQQSDFKWSGDLVKRNSLVLLYALRYLRHYLQTSDAPYRYDLALLELLHLSLPYGMAYKTASGVEIEGNTGRLFFESEREEVILQLQDMAEMEDYIRREILPFCTDETGRVNPARFEMMLRLRMPGRTTLM